MPPVVGTYDPCHGRMARPRPPSIRAARIKGENGSQPATTLRRSGRISQSCELDAPMHEVTHRRDRAAGHGIRPPGTRPSAVASREAHQRPSYARGEGPGETAPRVSLRPVPR
jgi:hypothetical protein